MARRRRIDPPSAEVLKEVEQGFEVKSASRPVASAPIARVAGEAAALGHPVSAEDRARAARDAKDADRLRTAEAEGRLAVDIPASQIQDDELTRDRTNLDAEAMAELKSSIAAHGLRTPIDVFQLEGGGYGLLSGFRRLRAVRELSGPQATIRAVVRAPRDVSDAYVAMVEENEVRANLSHYERGRVAVLAAGQGAFADTAAAVDALFGSGSKAKRSKIRSFAAIHEELGDLLEFPHALGERAGLRLAAALKAGAGAALRHALSLVRPASAEMEWASVLAVIEGVEKSGKAASGAGRPRVARAPEAMANRTELGNGMVMWRDQDREGYSIRFEGDYVDAEFIDTLMLELRIRLEKS